MSVIVNADGVPEAPTDLLRRLAQVDDRLSMRFLPMGGGCWAFTERWSETDPRRAMIQRGECAPDSDFDVLGYAPVGVTVDDAFFTLERSLRQRDQSRADFQYFLDRLTRFNADQTETNLQPMHDFADEMVDANRETLSGGATVISHGAGFSIDDTGKVVGTPKAPKKKLTASEREARLVMSDR